MTHFDRDSAGSLTDQGIAALKAGDKDRARELLTQATLLVPADERAWLWLSGTVSSDAERRACLERVLAISPQHPAALRGLQQLGPAVSVPLPTPTPPAPPAWAAAPEPAPFTPPVVPASPQPAAPAPTTRTLQLAVAQQPVALTARRPRWLLPALAVAPMLVLLLAVVGLTLLLGRGEQQQAAQPSPVATLAAIPVSGTRPVSATAQVAQQPLRISNSAAKIEFPDRVAFGAVATSKAGIERVVLEYGVDKLTCGTVVARVFPAFKAGTRADVSWTWEMRQSGSEPPGATIWYRWRVTAKDGAEQVSADQRVTWIDSARRWQEITRDKVTLHWYSAPPSFAEDLLDTAVESLQNLRESTGVAPAAPIQLYIYANTKDMRDAVLYEPGWTGGQAYAANSIVIIGIGEEQLAWGRRTVAHELTHVLVGHRTFACASSLPTWLNEGIAVYNEGGLEPESAAQLDAAVAANTLISVRALGGGFSEHPSQADLSYSQAWSLVNFLISEYGSDKLLALFDTLKGGTPQGQALNEIYGFDEDGLEDRWRASLKAKPRQNGAAPTATALATPVPTYAPVSGTFATPAATR